MKKARILQLLNQNLSHLEVLGVSSLALFGSVARGDFDKESDIDLLVEFTVSPSFDQYMDVKIYLEDLLQSKVDLVLEQYLRSRLKPYIQKDAIYVSGSPVIS